ncbi:MAG: hypothetical protein WCX46_03835 [Candidatus Paceibacterota bacterium]
MKKKINQEEYNKRMNSLMNSKRFKEKQFPDQLFSLLEEASKYNIIINKKNRATNTK